MIKIHTTITKLLRKAIPFIVCASCAINFVYGGMSEASKEKVANLKKSLLSISSLPTNVKQVIEEGKAATIPFEEWLAHENRTAQEVLVLIKDIAKNVGPLRNEIENDRELMTRKEIRLVKKEGNGCKEDNIFAFYLHLFYYAQEGENAAIQVWSRLPEKLYGAMKTELGKSNFLTDLKSEYERLIAQEIEPENAYSFKTHFDILYHIVQDKDADLQGKVGAVSEQLRQQFKKKFPEYEYIADNLEEATKRMHAFKVRRLGIKVLPAHSTVQEHVKHNRKWEVILSDLLLAYKRLEEVRNVANADKNLVSKKQAIQLEQSGRIFQEEQNIIVEHIKKCAGQHPGLEDERKADAKSGVGTTPYKTLPADIEKISFPELHQHLTGSKDIRVPSTESSKTWLPTYAEVRDWFTLKHVLMSGAGIGALIATYIYREPIRDFLGISVKHYKELTDEALHQEVRSLIELQRLRTENKITERMYVGLSKEILDQYRPLDRLRIKKEVAQTSAEQIIL